jgi:hypothetical protein
MPISFFPNPPDDSTLSFLPSLHRQVPGPSAVLSALVGSGLPAMPFTFCGFVEAKASARKKQFKELAGEDTNKVEK